jgi:hypothetical protein
MPDTCSTILVRVWFFFGLILPSVLELLFSIIDLVVSEVIRVNRLTFRPTALWLND